VALVATAAAPSPAAGAGRSAKPCTTRGHTVVANQLVRVFRINRPRITTTLYHACDLRTRRARFIDRRVLELGGLHRLALGRGIVAYEDVICDERGGGCDGLIFRLDVRRNRRERVARMPVDAAKTSDLVVTRTGAIAWIRGVGSAGRHVGAVDANGERTLEESQGVEAGSLAVAGRRVYWTSAGEARSALLD
jgi:hypothetical protein